MMGAMPVLQVVGFLLLGVLMRRDVHGADTFHVFRFVVWLLCVVVLVMIGTMGWEDAYDIAT